MISLRRFGRQVPATSGASWRTGATGRGRDGLIAAGLCLGLLLVYNANGREIGSVDSQPTKFAARELLLRGTLTLNHVVGATPEYARRWGFVLAEDGRYRSIYSPVPAILTAAVTWPFWKAGLVDIRAPLAPGLMAAVTASLLVAVAVVFAFFTARRRLPQGRATLLAVGLGVGTGFWSMASQTLWQTESAVFGLTLAVLALSSPRERFDTRTAIALGVGLGLTGASRPQLAPVVFVLLVGTWLRVRPRNAATATTIVLAFATVLAATNVRWFGHPLGAQAMLQDVNAQLHATGTMFSLQLEGFAGLLISPSRGILIFSPVVLVAAAGIRDACRAGWRSPLPWCVLALAAQYALYGSYSVWWGGHTYGPRYLIDVLPLAVPLAAEAMAPPRFGRIARIAAGLALAWSIIVAATGAFCYPHDQWNTHPASVDRNHSRLWSITDSQIGRCWERGPSPQNFSLISRDSIRTARR